MEIEFEEKPDVAHLCRLCGNTDNQLMPIFKGEGLEHNIPHKIKKHLPIIRISEADKLPLHICYQCASALISWSSLYEGCLIVEQRLRELLNEKYQAEPFENDCVDFHGDNLPDDETTKPTFSVENMIVKVMSDEPVESDVDNSEDIATNIKNKKWAARNDQKRRGLSTIESTASSAEFSRTTTNNVQVDSAAQPRSVIGRFIKAEDVDLDIDGSEAVASADVVGQYIATTVSMNRATVENDVKKEEQKCDLLLSVQPAAVIENVACRDGPVCHFCGYKCIKKSDMRSHIFKRHLNSGCDGGEGRSPPATITGVGCDLCGRGYDQLPSMFAHRDVVHKSAEPLTWANLRNCRGRLKRCTRCGNYYKDSKDNRFIRDHTCAPTDGDDKQFAEMEALLKAPPVYKCDSCSLCFVWKLLYRQHREDIHPQAARIVWNLVEPRTVPLYCNSCYAAFDSPHAQNRHRCLDYQSAVAAKEYRCQLCKARFQRRCDCVRHLRNKHATEYGERGEKHTSYTFTCPYCPLEARTKIKVVAHMKEAHAVESDTPFVCVPCNKKFQKRTTMETHNETYHPAHVDEEETKRVLAEAQILLDGERAFHCNQCSRKFYVPLEYLAHYRLHNIERKFVCDLCGKQSRTRQQLQVHKKFTHDDVRNYICDICGKGFRSSHSRDDHRRIHTGERPYSCETCGKTFIALNALLTHQKFHNDFYAHPCHLCPKKFKVRRSLLNHIFTHTGERPYKCELCGKTFNTSSRFSYHRKVTHSENRPHVCELCGSRFKANKFLMRHRKLHDARGGVQIRRKNNPAWATEQEGKLSAALQEEMGICNYIILENERNDDDSNTSVLRMKMDPSDA